VISREAGADPEMEKSGPGTKSLTVSVTLIKISQKYRIRRGVRTYTRTKEEKECRSG